MTDVPTPPPITGVIFDFHGTLVSGGDPDSWIAAALQYLADTDQPVPELAELERKNLRDFLDRLWTHAHAVDPTSSRDLSHAQHQQVFSRTMALSSAATPELGSALYAVMADQWTAFDDTLPVINALKARGTKVVVLSNIGLDIRPCLERAGLNGLVDGVVLSYEVGVVKPDPSIFAKALALLDVPAEEALMVGDSHRDDVGGATLGVRTLILPRTDGPVHGLGSVLQLVG